MSGLRVELATEFRGGPAVLFAMDRDSLASVRSVLEQAASEPRQPSTLRHKEGTITVLLGDGPTTIDLRGDSIVWHLSRAKLDEIVEKLEALEASDKPCHHYVDISEPADTLVLSKDEYP